MNPITPHAISKLAPRRSPKLLLGCAIAIASLSGAAIAQTSPAAQPSQNDKEYLLYLPSNSQEVDHAAIIEAFIDQGYEVSTYAYAGENQLDYARRIADEVRNLMDQGVAPENINVVGGGTGSAITLLTSAAVGNRHVDYVVLGNCDDTLKTQYRFRVAGNVLGISDVADSSSRSCRPFWTSAPKLRNRRDLVLDTGYGAALFDTARDEWMRPMVSWTRGGQVDVGATKVAAVPSE